MNAEEHNKTLGILHLVYGGLQFLSLLIAALFLIPLMLGFNSGGRGDDTAGILFLTFIFGFFGVFWLMFSIPPIVAGYGLLKRKSWAKLWAIIAGGMSGMSIPLGTALCVYTFWFLFNGGGKEMYEQQAKQGWGVNQPGVLHGAPEPSAWAGRSTYGRERETVYTPPPAPPNWRGE